MLTKTTQLTNLIFIGSWERYSLSTRRCEAITPEQKLLTLPCKPMLHLHPLQHRGTVSEGKSKIWVLWLRNDLRSELEVVWFKSVHPITTLSRIHLMLCYPTPCRVILDCLQSWSVHRQITKVSNLIHEVVAMATLCGLLKELLVGF